MTQPRALYSDEAEQALLGALLLNSDLYDAITSMVSPADFHDPENAALLKAIQDCHATGQPVDVVTVSDYRAWLPSGEPTIAYAGDLARNTPSTANWKAYARTVVERAVLRRLVDAADAVKASATDNRPVAEIVAQAQQAMADLRDLDDGEPDVKSIREIITHNIDVIDAKFNGRVQLGLGTGLADFDKLLRGLRRKKVHVVAGLPGSGKTTLGMQMAQHIAVSEGGTGLVFSMEMSDEELGNRVLASAGGIDLVRLDEGHSMADEDWPRLTAAVSKVADAPLFVCDRSGLTVSRIRSIARKVHRQHGLRVLVVDYIGLIAAEAKGRTRSEEVGKISKGLLNLCKELDVPLILLAQLNRDSLKRPGKRPISSDLRDSGEIEQDAHVIIMVHRDPDSEEGQNGVTELIMTKCRHAPVGSCLVQQQGKFARFVNFLGGPEPSQEEVEMGRPFAGRGYKGRRDD